MNECYCEIPQHRINEASITAKALGDVIVQELPRQEGVQPVSNDLAELLLNCSWRPTLTVVGASGLPALQVAGNVLRPQTTLRLSIRLPPLADGEKVSKALKALLETNPPFGAKVTCNVTDVCSGWNAKKLDDWVEASIEQAAKIYFNNNGMCVAHGGGSIPFVSSSFVVDNWFFCN